MKTFTYAELVQFIKDQPDDRSVSFASNEAPEGVDCGCLLVHFGRKHGLTGRITCGGWNIRENGICAIAAEKPSNFPVWKLVEAGIDNRPESYGQYRALLNL